MSSDGKADTDNLDLDELPAEEITWPRTLGIVSVVWGGLGLICNTWNAVSTLISAQPTLPGALWLAAGNVTLSVVLVVAGIVCIQRMPLARWLHIGWALLMLASITVGVIVFVVNKADLLDAIVQKAMDQQRERGQGNMTAEQMRGFITPFVTAMVYGMSIFFSLYPLFCLVWFGLIKRTRESMVGRPETP